MKANIHVGLEAGECVAGYSALGGRWGLPPFIGFPHAAGLCRPDAAGGGRCLAAASGAAWRDRGDRATVTGRTGDGIELSEGGRSLGLRYGGSRDPRDVNYSADAKGAMGARYVDSSTGYVTVVNVNVE